MEHQGGVPFNSPYSVSGVLSLPAFVDTAPTYGQRSGICCSDF